MTEEDLSQISTSVRSVLFASFVAFLAVGCSQGDSRSSDVLNLAERELATGDSDVLGAEVQQSSGTTIAPVGEAGVSSKSQGEEKSKSEVETESADANGQTQTADSGHTGQHEAHGDNLRGGWVRVGEERATFPSSQVRTVHHLFDPFAPKAPQDWGASRIGFVVHCEPVKVATIDPIVNPGQSESGHEHEFFGNPNVNPNSTTQSLADTPADQIECTDVNDKSAYWTPTVFQNGNRVAASHFKAYYKSPTPDTVPIPFGLRMIAGNPAATRNQDSQVGWWQAGGNTTQNRNSMISRGGSNLLTLRVNFPQCWDGVHLDSPDHQSHMAYANGRSCPESHPVKIPQVVTFTDYKVAGGQGFELSSGPWYTFHQDFWNAWSPEHFEDLHQECNLAELNCRARRSPALVPAGQVPKNIG